MSDQLSFDDAARKKWEAEEEKKITVTGNLVEIRADWGRVDITNKRGGIEIYINFPAVPGERLAIMPTAANVFFIGPVNNKKEAPDESEK